MEKTQNPINTPQLVFDKYEIVQRLAVGGMGEVFFAVQRSGVQGFERPVILKSLLPDLAERDDFIDQFLDEARVAATLNHPNVVSIYEVGQWDGVYFIAMEFIRGRNLSQIAKLASKKKTPVPIAVVAQVIQDAALGLHHAHSAKDAEGADAHIIHRDISPQNIMVRVDGVTKVVDFGIARANNRASRTATGTLKGKLSYMAPEQLTGKPITSSADQFALGVVMWELCAQQRLFQGEGDMAIINRVLEMPIPKLGTLVPGMPEELEDIVSKMLDRNPANRYANCAEVARDLDIFRARFSPATTESPASQFMSLLGFEDLATLTPKATPSRGNFIIDLRARAASPSKEIPIELEITHAERQKTVTTFNPRLVTLAIAGVVALLVGGGVTFFALRRDTPDATQNANFVSQVKDPGSEPKKNPSTDTVDPIAVKPSQAVAPAKLEIVTRPPGASVRINSGEAQAAPFSWEGAAGELQITVDAPGFSPQTKQVTLAAGANEKLEVVLSRKATSGTKPTVTKAVGNESAGGPGLLTVATTPDTKLWVDDKYVGLTPVARQEFPAGPHVITLRNDEEGILVKKKIVLKPGQVFKINDVLK